MTTDTHPSPSLLASYAAGSIALAPAMTLVCHLETCAACRAKVAVLEEVEGQLMEAMTPAPMAADALDRLMSRISDEGPEPPGEAPSMRLGDVLLPPRLAEIGLAPRRWMAPGLWTARVRLAPQDTWRAFVLRAPARSRIPMHRHVGREFISVLQGGFSDGSLYQAGDFLESGPDSAHRQQVTPERACACLIAVQGDIEWRGVARLIPPMLGI